MGFHAVLLIASITYYSTVLLNLNIVTWVCFPITDLDPGCSLRGRVWGFKGQGVQEGRGG